jgi:rhodanese-related sulfurtransferase
MNEKMNLKELINHPEATLIDVREPYELADGQVEGARNIPLNTIIGMPAQVKQFSRPVILFFLCVNRSGMASMTLKAMGVKEVYNGGSWQEVQSLLSAPKPVQAAQRND